VDFKGVRLFGRRYQADLRPNDLSFKIMVIIETGSPVDDSD